MKDNTPITFLIQSKALVLVSAKWLWHQANRLAD